jgi:hypothetical protein
MGQSEEQLPKLQPRSNLSPLDCSWRPVHELKTHLTDHVGNDMGEGRARCLYGRDRPGGLARGLG